MKRLVAAALVLAAFLSDPHPRPYNGDRAATDQGATPYCVGYALSLWVDAEWGPQITIDPRALMVEAHRLDGFQHKSEDEATTPEAGIAVLTAHGLATGYRRLPNLRAALPKLAQEPLLVALEWYNGSILPLAVLRPGGIYWPDWDRPIGAHALLLYDFDASRDEVLAQNSWGGMWADGGRVRLPVAVLNAMIGADNGGGVYEITLPITHNFVP